MYQYVTRAGEGEGGDRGYSCGSRVTATHMDRPEGGQEGRQDMLGDRGCSWISSGAFHPALLNTSPPHTHTSPCTRKDANSHQ